jgi:hypothetical protein
VRNDVLQLRSPILTLVEAAEVGVAVSGNVVHSDDDGRSVLARGRRRNPADDAHVVGQIRVDFALVASDGHFDDICGPEVSSLNEHLISSHQSTCLSCIVVKIIS